MISLHPGRVISVDGGWPGAAECQVSLDDGRTVRALAYVALVGEPEVGDAVVVNSSALDLGLGTGGYALVTSLPERAHVSPPGPGHLVKARYTPLQTVVLGVEEDDSPHRGVMEAATSLDGVPVVVADLHSALPSVLVGLRTVAPGARAVYVMTDGGALPLAFSKTVALLREQGQLVGTITAGQAFGGDLDAVTLHSALLAAVHVLGADVVVVTQGPGNLGAGTTWGFSGVAVGEAVNAVGCLGGRPVAVLRVSEADPRERHQGVSHHTKTALGRVALLRARVAVPRYDAPLAARVGDDLTSSGIAAVHDLVDVSVDGLLEALRTSIPPPASMGRSLDDDPAHFLAAAAAGVLAGQLHLQAR